LDTASIEFVLFGLAAAIISNFSRSKVWRSAILMVATIVFLGLLARNPLSLLPLAGFLLLGYGCLLLIKGGWAKSVGWLLLAVIFSYVWLKKYTFLPHEIFLSGPYFTLGLSYIFFRVLHLLIEARDSEENQHVSFGAYLLYTLNFTTFVSGPIQRYDEFAKDQFADRPIELGLFTISSQLERIVRGFFKVNVLAMLFDLLRQNSITQLTQPLPSETRLGAGLILAIVYPLFLYCNFSGYIDIVIALARLMRVILPENFDRPFAASSALDFWNRWHMTLSNWLKTYVYNPLLITLMRRFPSPSVEPMLSVFCFFVTFFLIGVWHGRTSEFVMFGVLTGGGMSVNKLWQLQLTRVMGRKGYRELAKNQLYRMFGRGLNFVWFSFTLFWFWADWKQIHAIFSALSVPQWISVWFTAWLVLTAGLAAWEWLRATLLSIDAGEGPVFANRYARTVYVSAMALTSLVVTVLLNQPAPGIVYKAF
jgi:D-alanyl-lipoteichoic acid acyltransferase DltB (MBOAT superfamily)